MQIKNIDHESKRIRKSNEKIIKKRLKPEYGDPYKIKDPEKRKAASAKVFGTAMKIQKAMDDKKKRMKKKSK